MKILFDTELSQLRPYPRSDDEPVVGLAPCYVVLDVIQAPEPSLAPGQRAVQTESINLETRQLLRGWSVESLPAQWANSQEFMAAFTDSEKAAIELSTDPIVAGMRRTLDTWDSSVHPDDVRVSGGLAHLVNIGILTEERKAAIIATAG
ncbi:hypothetical protein [Prosthecobacter sp.]|uniref:hypothetical protein n=1 Tax=Prosthecobacter sp. TaxID=1965333 RepID=UPI003784C282